MHTEVAIIRNAPRGETGVERVEPGRPPHPPGDSAVTLERPAASARARGELRVAVVLGRVLVEEYTFASAVVTVGRDPYQDVVLDNASVSRVHCKIRWEQGGHTVEDMHTRNGTLVNGRAATGAALRVPLAPGDELGVGKYVLIVQPGERQLRRLERPGDRQRGAAAYTASETQFLNLDEREHVLQSQAVERGAHVEVLVEGKVRRVALDRPLLVLGSGREADIRLRGWWIAGRHALIRRTAVGAFELEDLGGVRAVTVNGRAVQRHTLRHRDTIGVGRNRLRFFDAV